MVSAYFIFDLGHKLGVRDHPDVLSDAGISLKPKPLSRVIVIGKGHGENKAFSPNMTAFAPDITV